MSSIRTHFLCVSLISHALIVREFDFAFINDFHVMALCRNLWVAIAGTFVAPQGLILHSCSLCEFDFALISCAWVGFRINCCM